jgi:hypothetical protein
MTAPRMVEQHRTIITWMLDHSGSEAEIEMLSDFFTTVDRFAKLYSDGSWCRSLILAGMSGDQILEVWNEVDDHRRLMADQVRQKNEDREKYDQQF